VTPEAACRLYGQLQMRASRHPTKAGQTLRDVIVDHRPQPGEMPHGPDQAMCRGDGVPVTWPCPTTTTIARGLEVPVPAEVPGER
jgi:hypothetical protein